MVGLRFQCVQTYREASQLPFSARYCLLFSHKFSRNEINKLH